MHACVLTAAAGSRVQVFACIASRARRDLHVHGRDAPCPVGVMSVTLTGVGGRRWPGRGGTGKRGVGVGSK